MEVERRVEDRYDLVHNTSKSPTSLAKKGAHTRLIGALCEVKSETKFSERLVQTHNATGVKVRSAREGARFAGRKFVKSSR